MKMNLRTKETVGVNEAVNPVRNLGRRSFLLGAGAALSTGCGEGAEPWEESFAIAGEAVTYAPAGSVDFSSVPSWPYQTILNFFAFARDVRWLRMDGAPNIYRRVSWLYPDNGCESRSEIICHRAQISLLTKPYKIFVVGRVAPDTPNHPNGYVEWGFHVAPVVKSAGSGYPYVLDPALDPTRPLTFATWATRLKPIASVVFAAVPPSEYSLLSGGPGGIEEALDEQETTYLSLEWERQVELDRNPNQVLFDNPPW